MALQTTTNIDIDFYDKKYILINAKQYDRKSRNLIVTCYNHGQLVPINAGEYSAYVRYKKPDGFSVFNFCEIDRFGKIKVELTEQMLAAEGISCADLVIATKGDVEVDVETGEIIAINNASILSTMPIHIDITEIAIENSSIESSYEYNGLNTLLEKAEADYENIIKSSKSWAVGGTGIRDNENIDNSKYYCSLSINSANKAESSENNALNSEQKAKISEENAKLSETNAKKSETNAFNSEQNAKDSEVKAKQSEANALNSETNTKLSESNALASEQNAKISENNASVSEQNAKNSEMILETSANVSQSYAVGGTGTRENEDKDNAHYYYEMAKAVADGLNSGFIPIGTISFSELATAEKVTGFTYNISDDFVTDEDFAEGEGKSYTAGTNVYCRSDGLWDCFGGSASPTATVDEVRDYLGI